MSRKRKAAGNGQSPKTRRLNLQVNVDAVERLIVHGMKWGRGPGEIVSDLIEQHLRFFRVQENTTGKSPDKESGNLAGQVNNSPALAPIPEPALTVASVLPVLAS